MHGVTWGFPELLSSSLFSCFCRRAEGDAEVQDEHALHVDTGTTTGSGEGFNTLAGYLFGNNTQELAMDMTTPVNIDVSPAGGR